LKGRQGELQAEADRAAAALQDATGGFGPEQALKDIAAYKAELERYMKTTVDVQAGYLQELERQFERAVRRLREIENANL
jgi:hypothetical protein